jgi:hypothetical protein
MKLRFILLIVILVCLVASTQATAHNGSGASGQDTTLRGGHYRLISVPIDAGSSTGGNYRLTSAAPAVDPAAGCCCKTNLPCVLK